MARQSFAQRKSLQCLSAVAVLLAVVAGADALCYVSPITGIRTCTSFGWPGSNGGYNQPPRNNNGNSNGYNQPPRNNYGNNNGYNQQPNAGYGNNGGYQQGGNSHIGRPGYAPAPPTYAPTPSPTYAPTHAPTYAPTPAPYVEAPAPTRGCFGDLPFGLQNCVCDGAVIGEAAGLAACSMVFAQCAPLVGFSAPDDPKLDAIQQACDSLTGSSCVLTGKQLAMSNPTCASLLQGSGTCSPAEAEAILEASVSRTCEPLCPDCDKPLPNKPEGYGDDYSSKHYEGGVSYENDGYKQLDSYVEGDVSYEQVDNSYQADTSYEQYPQNGNAYANEGEQYPQVETSYEQYPQEGNTYEEEVHGNYDAADPHSQGKGCFGGLPFGLETCVCDGASIGEAAGLAACSAVFSECAPFVPFSAGGAEEAISRACDSLAMSSCSDTARQLAVQNEQCARLLFEGSRNCSVDKARKIFRGTIDNVCTPLCPGCATLP